jgi:hypothetical protein
MNSVTRSPNGTTMGVTIRQHHARFAHVDGEHIRGPDRYRKSSG